MAQFRLQHGIIGRTHQRPGTAAHHMRYILRPGAATWTYIHVPIGVVPDRDGVSRWIASEERLERKNGRLLDTLIGTLPRELLDLERHALVERFVERVTQHQIPVVAGIHDEIMTKDEFNPHAHIAIRDRMFGTADSRHRTGVHFLNTTASHVKATPESIGSTQWFRAQWEEAVNEALDLAGYYNRVDRRSAFEQGRTERPRPFVPRGTWNRIIKKAA